MAPSISSARELEIASRKRPSSPSLFGSDPLSEFSDSPSDFENPNNRSKKPVKKKARTTKAPATLPKADILPKIPKEYQSDEANPLFSVKWYKEITKRDAFWADLQKKVPKAIWQKRFKVEVAIGLNEESRKASRGGEKTISDITKPRRTTRQPDNTSPTADLLTNADAGKDATIASTELVRSYRQTRTEDSTTLSSDAKLEQGAARASQDPANTGAATRQDNDDLYSRIPGITPEEKARYIAASQEQERTAKIIEMQVEEKNRLEKDLQGRAAAKEHRAAEKANVEAGDAEEQTTIESGEGGKGEQQRKPFAPTRF